MAINGLNLLSKSQQIYSTKVRMNYAAILTKIAHYRIQNTRGIVFILEFNRN